MLFRNSVAVSLLTGVLVSLNLQPAAAWQRSSGRAITNLSEVDRDFYYQGEYQGSVVTAGRPFHWRQVGLQVVALGDGEFSAVAYEGGLPGSGWDRLHKERLTGHLQDGMIWFFGRRDNYVVEGRTAMVYRSTHQPLGQIPRVQRKSPTLGVYPPAGARVIFDGTGTDAFSRGRMTYDGLLQEGADFENAYRDYSLHIEFRLPYMPHARGQRRGNSGVYLQSRYEVQVLDSFGLEGEHNECGGLYRQRRPDLNMCFPPLTWQTYDLDFTAPRFDANGNKIKNARLTVWHNGVLIHNNVEITGKTGAGRLEGPQPLPIRLQDHRNPVRFRNIWLVEHHKNVAIPSPPFFPHRPRGYRYPVQRVHWLY